MHNKADYKLTKEQATKLFSSVRGSFLMGKAIAVAICQIEKEEGGSVDAVNNIFLDQLFYLGYNLFEPYFSMEYISRSDTSNKSDG